MMAEKTPVAAAVRFDKRGLIPAIVQDCRNEAVLMLGYMNEEALKRTQSSGQVWFWSRSRQELWHKGSTSGNYLRVESVRLDCDGDTVLVRAEPLGPTCHTGEPSCFAAELPAVCSATPATLHGGAVLDALFETIESRRRSPEPGSYTNHLLTQGVDRIARKLGEETAEVIVAAKNGSQAEISNEVADLFYHLLVLLSAQGVSLAEVAEVLRLREGAPRRHNEPSGG
jgi:phosphoribosyl-ATP pyrophosphohydrolase/phosphoribosyl-AMP cyclohydrolase